MENIKVQTQNKLENYQPSPNLFYDVEGKVIAIDDKKLTLEKEVGFEVVEYTLNLKEKKEAAIGEEIKVDKEEISSIKLERKEKILPEDIENIGEILKALGLQNTSANILMVNKLVRQGIEPTKINVSNYMKSIENLDKIEENLSVENLIKLLDKDIDLENLSIDEMASQLEGLSNPEKSLFDLLKLKKDLDYKDAEKISKEIFGQKMGKDVYDIIIALDREAIEINQENIEKSMEILGKLSSIKSLETGDFVKVLNEDLDFTINNLYRIKNNYTKSTMDENKFAKNIEGMTVEKELDYSNLVKVLDMEGLERTEENIGIAREFILLDMDIESGRLNRVKDMKNTLDFIRDNLELEEVGYLIENKVDILNTNLDELVEMVQAGRQTQTGLVDLSFLDKVEDKHLLDLLRSGKDFNLSDLKTIVDTNLPKDKSIEIKVLDKLREFDTIFKFLGDKPEFKNLDYKKDISLNKIYENALRNENVSDLKSILKKDREFLSLEFERFKNNIDTKAIKKSIVDRLDLGNIPLDEANNYMENKVNRYREASRLMREFNAIYKNKETILPSIINNQLDMDYKSLKDLDGFLNGGESLDALLEEVKEDMKDEARIDLEVRKETISNKLKDKADIREDYFELMNLLEKFDFGDNNQGSSSREKYFEMITKSSKKDLVLQVPVDIKGFKDLNIIIPNMDKSIDKNKMNFKLGLETENLGSISMDLSVMGKNIYLNTENISVVDRYGHILREKLEKSGYNLILGD